MKRKAVIRQTGEFCENEESIENEQAGFKLSYSVVSVRGIGTPRCKPCAKQFWRSGGVCSERRISVARAYRR